MTMAMTVGLTPGIIQLMGRATGGFTQPLISSYSRYPAFYILRVDGSNKPNKATIVVSTPPRRKTWDAPARSVAIPARAKPIGSRAVLLTLLKLATRPRTERGTRSCNTTDQTRLLTARKAPIKNMKAIKTGSGKGRPSKAVIRPVVHKDP